MHRALLALALMLVLAPAAEGEDEPACASHARFTQQGKASWYGTVRHGRTMANGERMDRDAPIAAHRHLPLGSRIRVTNLANGSTVELTVTDRGPYAHGRILDVSKGAAEQLGFRDSGTTQVRIEALGCAQESKGL